MSTYPSCVSASTTLHSHLHVWPHELFILLRRRHVRAELRPRNARQQLLAPGPGRRGREEEEEKQRVEEREKDQREEESRWFCGGSGEEDQKERIWPLKVGNMKSFRTLTSLKSHWSWVRNYFLTSNTVMMFVGFLLFKLSCIKVSLCDWLAEDKLGRAASKSATPLPWFSKLKRSPA